MNDFQAVILGLVEGITEFLPVSSTGHLILTKSLLGLAGEPVDRHLIVIQGAAILAVCFEYRQRLWDTIGGVFSQPRAQRFVLVLLMAFLPLAILGLIFDKPIERLLFAPIPVAIALIVGGVLMLWAESRQHVERIATVDDLRPSDGLKLGLFQALALFPGTSRSAATIIGGLLMGMNRRSATEFSFLAAIPVLLAATFYKMWQARATLSFADARPLLVSSVVAFIAALLSLRLLLRYVSQHSFAVFAWYRIVFGLIVLGTWASGLIRW